MTRQSPYAVLYQEDEIVTTGSQQVTAQMEEILGMDRMQYQQISMIAQGEFLKLLYAKGKERQLKPARRRRSAVSSRQKI